MIHGLPRNGASPIGALGRPYGGVNGVWPGYTAGHVRTLPLTQHVSISSSMVAQYHCPSSHVSFAAARVLDPSLVLAIIKLAEPLSTWHRDLQGNGIAPGQLTRPRLPQQQLQQQQHAHPQQLQPQAQPPQPVNKRQRK